MQTSSHCCKPRSPFISQGLLLGISGEQSATHHDKVHETHQILNCPELKNYPRNLHVSLFCSWQPPHLHSTHCSQEDTTNPHETEILTPNSCVGAVETRNLIFWGAESASTSHANTHTHTHTHHHLSLSLSLHTHIYNLYMYLSAYIYICIWFCVRSLVSESALRMSRPPRRRRGALDIPR